MISQHLRRGLLAAFLSFAILTSSRTPPPGGEERGIEDLGFWIGNWSLESEDRTPSGTVRGRAISEVSWILDGHALQDDFRALSPAGEVVFRGTSIRTYDAGSSEYLIRWLMVGDPGMTEIRATLEDGVFEGHGKGSDRAGAFLERFVYTFSEDRNEYEFRMDRSYDAGETWVEDYSVLHAQRVPREEEEAR